MSWFAGRSTANWLLPAACAHAHTRARARARARPPLARPTIAPTTHPTRLRTMIIIVLVSIAGQYGLKIHEERGAGAELACHAAFLLVMGGSVLHAVRSLEEAEVYKKKFGVTFAKCAEGIEPDSDRLGPKPLNNPYLAQEGNQSVDFYLAEAARLYEAFQRDVLGVLSDAADPTGEVITVLSNLKKREVRPPPPPVCMRVFVFVSARI